MEKDKLMKQREISEKIYDQLGFVSGDCKLPGLKGYIVCGVELKYYDAAVYLRANFSNLEQIDMICDFDGNSLADYNEYEKIEMSGKNGFLLFPKDHDQEASYVILKDNKLSPVIKMENNYEKINQYKQTGLTRTLKK